MEELAILAEIDQATASCIEHLRKLQAQGRSVEHLKSLYADAHHYLRARIAELKRHSTQSAAPAGEP